ncbi:MAG TPA: threonine/serine exporter family protein [Rhodanobacteraceae bacterium]|nr:threonine/serine exporter family protein [Rhodanobacteraceae bacterium]
MSARPTLEPVTRARIGFVIELARRLHQYGAAAPRLEQAVDLVAQKLGLQCETLSTPTSTVVSFSERDGDGLAQITQVLRMAPGDVNLARLCRADEIADRVIDGSMQLSEGFRELHALGRPLSRPALTAIVCAYGLAAASVAVLFGTAWVDAVAAGGIGLLIGLLSIASLGRPRLAAASEAIAALIATFIATTVSAWIVPLALKSVVISALIVLVPGMTLTNAVRELSSQHLVSGVSRMAGALATLLKLTFGTVAASQICALLGIVPAAQPLPALPEWAQWPALLVAALSFAMLFQAARRDYALVVVAVVLSYLVSHFGGTAFGAAFGVFLGGLLLGALGNLYARVAQRPGSLVREPGILLLVPGSVGFRSVSFLLTREVGMGAQTAILLVTLLISLVAGLLFGDLLIAPRRSL